MEEPDEADDSKQADPDPKSRFFLTCFDACSCVCSDKGKKQKKSQKDKNKNTQTKILFDNWKKQPLAERLKNFTVVPGCTKSKKKNCRVPECIHDKKHYHCKQCDKCKFWALKFCVYDQNNTVSSTRTDTCGYHDLHHSREQPSRLQLFCAPSCFAALAVILLCLFLLMLASLAVFLHVAPLVYMLSGTPPCEAVNAFLRKNRIGTSGSMSVTVAEMQYSVARLKYTHGYVFERKKHFIFKTPQWHTPYTPHHTHTAHRTSAHTPHHTPHHNTPHTAHTTHPNNTNAFRKLNNSKTKDRQFAIIMDLAKNLVAAALSATDAGLFEIHRISESLECLLFSWQASNHACQKLAQRGVARNRILRETCCTWVQGHRYVGNLGQWRRAKTSKRYSCFVSYYLKHWGISMKNRLVLADDVVDWISAIKFDGTRTPGQIRSKMRAMLSTVTAESLANWA